MLGQQVDPLTEEAVCEQLKRTVLKILTTESEIEEVISSETICYHRNEFWTQTINTYCHPVSETIIDDQCADGGRCTEDDFDCVTTACATLIVKSRDKKPHHQQAPQTRLAGLFPRKNSLWPLGSGGYRYCYISLRHLRLKAV
jgi:hypothetical protein